MTPQEIEDSKTIAEFMGFKERPNCKNRFDIPVEMQVKYEALSLDLKDIKYHTSWDALIPVIIKLKNINYMALDTKIRDIYYGHVFDISKDIFNIEIKYIFSRVATAIRWYKSIK